MEGAFDTGPYLNVIERFVAEGSLLIFTCTKIHSAGKCPAEGPVSREAVAWVGEAVGKRFHVPPPPPALSLSLFLLPVGLSSPKRKGDSFSPLNGQSGWVGAARDETLNEKRGRGEERWRGGAGEERRQEERSE